MDKWTQLPYVPSPLTCYRQVKSASTAYRGLTVRVRAFFFLNLERADIGGCVYTELRWLSSRP